VLNFIKKIKSLQEWLRKKSNCNTRY